jgi:ribonuclease HII
MSLYNFENELYQKGIKYIAGCDEVGRGPLAGPVVCAAVILDPKNTIEGLNDSKKLSENKRRKLSQEIKEKALAYYITYIEPALVDQINVYQSSKRGMIEAVRKLQIKPEHVLSDAMPLTELGIPFTSIIKGDSKSASIAAASIIAKVSRDKYMVDMAKRYPNYGFDMHKGYPTKKHIDALNKFGVTEIHRKTYKPVYDLLNKQQELEL